MINGLLTLRGAWDKVREDPVLKMFVVGVTAYGMSTFEGPMLSLKTVNALSHFTDWTIAHVHVGALGWNGFLTFGVTDYVATMRTLHYGAALPGRPKTDAEKEICRRLGVRLAEWVSFYVDGVAESHPNHAEYARRA